MKNFMEKVKEIIAKLKKIKNIEIIIGIVIICIVVLIYSSVAGSNKAANKKASSEGEKGSVGTSKSITADIESRLSYILSKIDGAGEVNVMITYLATAEKVTASTTNSNKTSSSTNTVVTETQTPILVTVNGKSEVIVLKEIMPKVQGVIVVAAGAGTMKVRQNILNAVQAVLAVNANQVEIFAGNK